MEMKELFKNEELKNRLLEAKDKAEAEGLTENEFAEKAFDIIKAAGYDVTLQEVMDSIEPPETELSDDDMEKIAGGTACGKNSSEK